MKQFKSFAYVLLATVFLTSCEPETITPETTDASTQETKQIIGQKPLTLFEITQLGSLDAYFRSFENTQNKIASQTVAARSYNPNIQFFNSPEGFNNNALPMEDFENAIMGFSNNNYYDSGEWSQYVQNSGSDLFPGILNEDNLHGIFNEGDFASGISFELIKNEDDFQNNSFRDYLRNQYDWTESEIDDRMEELIFENGFYIYSEAIQYVYYPQYNFSHSKPLTSNYDFTDLEIKFSENNINAVSLNILRGGSFTFNIYDRSGNIIATDYTYLASNSNSMSYWAVKSGVAIGKIVIISDYLYTRENVDNVAFGNEPDLDGDGVINSEDKYPFSNFTPEFRIYHTNLGIANKLARNGATMMDELESLITSINAEYNGDNYRALHSKFTKELAKLSYYWYKDRLITSRERSAISRAAYSADVPMFVD
ncbi:hypothetical protein [Lutibacter sp.]|uniref:hypothetical protein n=1 Tax=Lutibacter sp. TaxID=1925666 RepID=UPI001A217D69|nr:hypothetical protein [Lutibacter sp.]MBI9041923.1 hypothetical protein [Lutibacter sp.]